MGNDKRIEINEFLNNLPHKRKTLRELNKELSILFNEDISIHNISKERDDKGGSDELQDFNFLFGSEKKETYGYFDIYMLPTREKDVFYITEVGIEFE